MRTWSLFKMERPLQLRRIRTLTRNLTSRSTHSSWSVQMNVFGSLVLGFPALGDLCGERSELIVLAREQRKRRSPPSAPVEATPRSGRRVRRDRLRGSFGSFRRDVVAGLAHATRGSITSAAPLGPLVVRRQVMPHKLFGRTRKWQSPLRDTPPEFAHFSEVCDYVDLAPTSLAQGRNEPRGTSRNAPKGKKCANLCGVRTCSEALGYRSLSFSSRRFVRTYVITFEIGATQNAFRTLPGRSDHPRSKISAGNWSRDPELQSIVGILCPVLPARPSTPSARRLRSRAASSRIERNRGVTARACRGNDVSLGPLSRFRCAPGSAVPGPAGGDRSLATVRCRAGRAGTTGTSASRPDRHADCARPLSAITEILPGGC
jgi:hypothetical protein